MSDQWLNLILVAIAAGFLPWQFSAEVLILGKEHGLRRAAAFAGGITFWRFLIGIVMALVFAGSTVVLSNRPDEFSSFLSSGFQSGSERIESRQGPVLDILLIVAGMFLVLRAMRVWMGHPDPDAPPPKILSKLGSIGVPAAFGFGVAWIAISIYQWIFLATGVNQILGMDGGLALKFGAYLLFLAIASLLIVTPIVYYALQPVRAKTQLAALEVKLSSSMYYIGAVLMFGAGLYLAWRGLDHLFG